jgi:hypothetical protein
MAMTPVSASQWRPIGEVSHSRKGEEVYFPKKPNFTSNSMNPNLLIYHA